MNVRNILIGEDEPSLARALQIKLTSAGYITEVASNGNEVLARLETTSFDLLLLDLIMPTVDGFAVLEKLKEQRNTMPVIVTSNLRQEEIFTRAKGLGATDYIVKSQSSLSDIISKIKKVLDDNMLAGTSVQR